MGEMRTRDWLHLGNLLGTSCQLLLVIPQTVAGIAAVQAGTATGLVGAALTKGSLGLAFAAAATPVLTVIAGGLAFAGAVWLMGKAIDSMDKYEAKPTKPSPILDWLDEKLTKLSTQTGIGRFAYYAALGMAGPAAPISRAHNSTGPEYRGA